LEMEDRMNMDKLSGGNGHAAILEKSNELSEQRSDAQVSTILVNSIAIFITMPLTVGVESLFDQSRPPICKHHSLI
jgi:hypothetical protein